MSRRILAFRANYFLIVVYGLICLVLATFVLFTSGTRLPYWVAIPCGIGSAAIGLLCAANGIAGIIVTVRDPSILPERTNERWPTQGIELFIKIRKHADGAEGTGSE